MRAGSSPGGVTVRNIAWLLVVHGTTLLLPLATVPHLTRTLGAEGFGLGAYLLSFAGVTGILLDYGFNVTVVRDIAVAVGNDLALRAKVASVFWAKVILLGFVVVGSTVVIVAIPRLRENGLLAVLALAGVAGTSFAPVWIYQGLQEIRAMAGVIAFVRLAQVGGIIGLVRRPEDVFIWLSLTAGLNLLLAVLLWAGLIRSRQLAPGRFNLRSVLAEIRGGRGAFASQALIGTYTIFSTFLVGSIIDLRAAGLYSAAERLVRTVAGLIGPINHALAPNSSRLASVDRPQAVRRATRALGAVAILGVSASVAVAVVGPRATVLIFGSEFEAAAGLVRLLAPLPALVSVSGVLSWQFIIAFRRDASLAWSYGVAAMINLSAALILVPKYGVVGMAISVLLAESYVVVHQAVSSRNAANSAHVRVAGL